MANETPRNGSTEQEAQQTTDESAANQDVRQEAAERAAIDQMNIDHDAAARDHARTQQEMRDLDDWWEAHEFDLTDEPASLGSTEASPSPVLVPTKAEPFNLDNYLATSQERTRSKLAWVIVGTVPACLLAAYIALVVYIFKADNPTIEDVKDVLLATITPIIGLAGAVAGFYFGNQLRHHQD